MAISEIISGTEDLSWLAYTACADADLEDFFVEAGHVIADETLEMCRSCPVREPCIRFAYRQRLVGGYFAGISPGQRREMDLDEALVYIRNDPPQT